MDDREERVRRRLESGNFTVHEHFPKDVKVAVQSFLEASRMMITEELDYVPIEYLQKLLKTLAKYPEYNAITIDLLRSYNESKDSWTDAVTPGEVFESLTDGLEYVFQKSQGKDTEFHLSAFKGQIYSVHTETEQKETKRYSLYGEDTENIHVS